MTIKNTLKTVVEETDTLPSKLFAFFIQSLILLSLITFSLETLPDLSPEAKKMFRMIEIAIVAVFTVEYLLRIYIADHKFRFIFSFFGLVDLAAVLPFYLATGLDLRTLRLFRLLRLVRILKLVRYNKAIKNFQQAIRIAREELILFGLITLIVFYLSAVGIYYFENEAQPEQFRSVIHSLWWAVATFTTVGYGDIYPVTAGGRVFTFIILIAGLGIVAVPTGIISSALTKASEKKDDLED